MSNHDKNADLRRLATKYEMDFEKQFHVDPRGFVIMTRGGVEYLQARIKAVVSFETVPEWSDTKEGKYCVKAYAKCEMGQVETYGEVSKSNNRNAYPIAMAEKRALSRAILKLAGFGNTYGEDELEQ
tara:strand:+ start:389 stop:769 length:381 start_codon:yes stop_codon:yes gene_type:complete